MQPGDKSWAAWVYACLRCPDCDGDLVGIQSDAPVGCGFSIHEAWDDGFNFNARCAQFGRQDQYRLPRVKED